MKKLTLFLFCFILAASLWAEEESKEAPTEKPSESGGFGRSASSVRMSLEKIHLSQN